MGAAGVGEIRGEPGVAVDFDQQRRQVHSRQPGGGRCGKRFDIGGYLFGGQRRPDQRAVVVKAGDAGLSGRPLIVRGRRRLRAVRLQGVAAGRSGRVGAGRFHGSYAFDIQRERARLDHAGY